MEYNEQRSKTITEKIYSTNDPKILGKQDLLIIALKSHSAALNANSIPIFSTSFNLRNFL